MNTKAFSAAVTGARHLRTGRNGQDAAAAWAAGDAACVVVCDGCGSGASSEVGARLGAQLFVAAVAAHVEARGLEGSLAIARVEVTRTIGALLERMPGDRTGALHDYFLFTIVAAVRLRDEAAVYAIGDGGYAIDGRPRVLGPFADNQPPYVAYDLIGNACEAHLVRADGAAAIVIATDGADALDLTEFADPRLAANPDALRRRLAVLARTDEKIDWEARRVLRTPARVQDDCAIGVLLATVPS